MRQPRPRLSRPSRQESHSPARQLRGKRLIPRSLKNSDRSAWMSGSCGQYATTVPGGTPPSAGMNHKPDESGLKIQNLTPQDIPSNRRSSEQREGHDRRNVVAGVGVNRRRRWSIVIESRRSSNRTHERGHAPPAATPNPGECRDFGRNTR